jgi:hypothetical protein
VGHLHLAVGVLVDGQGVDHPDRVTVAQPFQLLDDLPVEIGVVEPPAQQLHRSDSHDGLLSRTGRLAWPIWGAAALPRASRPSAGLILIG